MNLNKIKELNNNLTEGRIKEIKKNPVQEISSIAKFLGYNAIGKEITNNRRAKDNFRVIIKNMNDFINLTEEEYELVKETQSKLIDLSYLLPTNTLEQLEYLKLVQAHENATYTLAEQYKELDTKEDREEYLNYSKTVEEYQNKFEDTKNKLDQFILSKI